MQHTQLRTYNRKAIAEDEEEIIVSDKSQRGSCFSFIAAAFARWVSSKRAVHVSIYPTE